METMNQLSRQPSAQAITDAFKQVKLEQAKKEEPSFYLAHGVGRPVTTPLEHAVADIQAATAIAQEFLNQTIEENNYSKEKAAALTVEAYSRIEAMAIMYADLLTRSPETAIQFRRVVNEFLEHTEGKREEPKNYLVNSA